MEAKNYCPTCKARRETQKAMGYYTDDLSFSIVICKTCGTAFDPQYSEELVVKCFACGGEDFPGSDFLYVDAGYRPVLCAKCKQKP